MLEKRVQKIKLRYMFIALFVTTVSLNIHLTTSTEAESCPDVKIIFARGSGGERWTDQNYLAFKSTLETKLKTTPLNYDFLDLDYPAVGVGVDNLSVTLGAFFGAGEAYEFGESVNTGVNNLTKIINSSSCKNTKYVIGGYSQGAMVVSKSLDNLNSDKMIYAATFGDPKLYLPEGKGLIPAACRGANLSDYRKYVPDCQAYKGLLGAYIPYEPNSLSGKVGTWCNKRDIFCSAHLSISDHVSYVSDNLYEDASRVIFDKITKTFGIENHISSPHDTAILIDSTASMTSMIDQYKAEALRLAKETLESGGRVALYDYRDLDDPYEAVEHCNFETCTLEIFESELAKIKAENGGDTPESLLSSSFKVMKALNWKRGSTKSLVALTNANFLSPDRDGMSFDEVVRLSKEIDPVNFYIITEERWQEDYVELVNATDGLVVTDFGELSLLTDYIMNRYDSLPRVEETEAPIKLPTIELEKVDWLDDETVEIKFKTTGEKTLIILNDKILGMTDETTIQISDIEYKNSNLLTLVSIGEETRGEAIEVSLDEGGMGGEIKNQTLKAPNTGRK